VGRTRADAGSVCHAGSVGYARSSLHNAKRRMNPQVSGVLDFYTSVLGLRLVKLTVNFDDPGTYRFYFPWHGVFVC